MSEQNGRYVTDSNYPFVFCKRFFYLDWKVAEFSSAFNRQKAIIGLGSNSTQNIRKALFDPIMNQFVDVYMRYGSHSVNAFLCVYLDYVSHGTDHLRQDSPWVMLNTWVISVWWNTMKYTYIAIHVCFFCRPIAVSDAKYQLFLCVVQIMSAMVLTI